MNPIPPNNTHAFKPSSSPEQEEEGLEVSNVDLDARIREMINRVFVYMTKNPEYKELLEEEDDFDEPVK